MLYLKFMDPETHRMRSAAATLANMFSHCHVCGAEVHLTMDEVTRNRNVWGNEYMCPACRRAFISAMCTGNDDDLDDVDPFDCDDDEEETADERNDEESEEDEDAGNRDEESHGDEPSADEGGNSAPRDGYEFSLKDLCEALNQMSKEEIGSIIKGFIAHVME